MNKNMNPQPHTNHTQTSPTTTPNDVVEYNSTPILPPQPPSSPSLSTTSTGSAPIAGGAYEHYGGATAYNTSQACAACKYQRRRCGPHCRLAPYFPANRHDDFINAHKLYGVSNINKILKIVPEQQRAEAMTSVVFESNMRARDKVGGCYRLIVEMDRQLGYYLAVLDILRKKIAVCRAQRFSQRGMLVNSVNVAQGQGRSVSSNFNLRRVANIDDNRRMKQKVSFEDIVGIRTADVLEQRRV